LSASLINLHKMLDICYGRGSTLDIQFNVDESFFLSVGKSYSITACLEYQWCTGCRDS